MTCQQHPSRGLSLHLCRRTLEGLPPTYAWLTLGLRRTLDTFSHGVELAASRLSYHVMARVESPSSFLSTAVPHPTCLFVFLPSTHQMRYYNNLQSVGRVYQAAR